MNTAERLFAVARRLPEQPAVTHSGRTLSYAGLAANVAAIAGAFRHRYGLVPGERVVLFMENGTAFLEALFACWTAGLCAVPTNAKLHAREVEHIVRNSGARLCLTTPGIAGTVTPLEGTVEGLDAVLVAGDARFDDMRRHEPIAPHEAGADEMAWIFYTSGTTGRPKGAVLSHRNLIFMSHCYYADVERLDETDTKLHAAPLSHASGLYALPHMFQGGHQVILSGFEPGEVFEAIAHYPKVTIFGAPTMVTRLVNSPEGESADTANLKTLYFGGGPMYVADLRRALERFGPKLFHLYGQGESPMTITGLDRRLLADPGHPRYEALLGSCGVARTGVGVKVVDADDRELPPGEVGEVITRSDCVMSEYWANPEASAETLRGGWLHTGDLGSMDAHGFLTLRDRSKDMIISGGSNIYPREIEEVLLTHPAVLECSVVGRPHADWGEEVVAFVVAREGAEVDRETLDTLCLDNIARFKRPKDYRFVESLPKNNYGKVLKTELRNLMQETQEEKA